MNIALVKERLEGHTPGILGSKGIYSVLIPVAEIDGSLYLFFETRSKGVVQGGEVCFPGGGVEEGETILEAALRETEEEVGISREDIEIVTQFDTVAGAGNRTIHSFIGIVKPEAVKNAVPEKGEVDEFFSIPVSFLMENEPFTCDYPVVPQIPKDFPYEKIGQKGGYNWRVSNARVISWEYEGHYLWGLTAALTKAFLEHLK